MKRSRDRDDLWITTSNPVPLAAYSCKQAFTGLIKRFYGFGPDENSMLGQDPGGTLLFPWAADWREWGEEGGGWHHSTLADGQALWSEGDGGRRSLFGPLLLWQQHREIDAKSSWYKQSVPVPSPLGAHWFTPNSQIFIYWFPNQQKAHKGREKNECERCTCPAGPSHSLSRWFYAGQAESRALGTTCIGHSALRLDRGIRME